LEPHGAAQLVGAVGVEPGHVDGHLHELFLEEWHPRVRSSAFSSKGCGGVGGSSLRARRM
jgi:hypothetical protein